MTPGQMGSLDSGYFRGAAWLLAATLVVVVAAIVPFAVYEIRLRRANRRADRGA